MNYWRFEASSVSTPSPLFSLCKLINRIFMTLYGSYFQSSRNKIIYWSQLIYSLARFMSQSHNNVYQVSVFSTTEKWCAFIEVSYVYIRHVELRPIFLHCQAFTVATVCPSVWPMSPLPDHSHKCSIKDSPSLGHFLSTTSSLVSVLWVLPFLIIQKIWDLTHFGYHNTYSANIVSSRY